MLFKYADFLASAGLSPPPALSPVASLLHGYFEPPGVEPLGLKRPLELFQVLLKDFAYSRIFDNYPPGYMRILQLELNPHASELLGREI